MAFGVGSVAALLCATSISYPTLLEQKDYSNFLKNICEGNLYVHPEVLRYLDTKKTKNGVDLTKVLISGNTHPEGTIGIYAGDLECYDTFAPVFDAAILYYHKKDSHTPNMTVPKLKVPTNLKIEAKTTRIRIARNLADYPFPTSMTLLQRLQLEEQVSKILLNKFGGRYYTQAELEKDPELRKSLKVPTFDNQDHYLQTSGSFDDWPHGRGVYVSDDKVLVIWIGEEDHIRMQTFASGFNFQLAFEKLAAAHAEIEKYLTFARTEKYGYMNACPTNCGTGMRSSIHVKFNHIADDVAELKKIADSFGLAVRPQGGEAASFAKGPQIVDISNKVRLGLGEADIVKNVHDGILKMAEADLQKGRAKK